ncbi:MAG: cell division topological specificity factor MinE [Clostridiales bacterium]|nr:cell division topological specificity factor MinE [Clostridiales bacterium]
MRLLFPKSVSRNRKEPYGKSAWQQNRSAFYARERLRVLLISERIDCSPQMMKRLRKELIHTVKKYIIIDENQVDLQISQEPCVLRATIPVLKKRDD